LSVILEVGEFTPEELNKEDTRLTKDLSQVTATEVRKKIGGKIPSTF
jgi:hypothetical protein